VALAAIVLGLALNFVAPGVKAASTAPASIQSSGLADVVSAAARFAIDPAVLLAFRDRVGPALEEQRARSSAAPDQFGGPYGITSERWIDAIRTEGRRLPGTPFAALVNGGEPGAQQTDLLRVAMAARDDLRLSSLIVAANLAFHIRLIRERLQVEPTLTELYIGHQMGPVMMMKVAKAARTTPSVTVVSRAPVKTAVDRARLLLTLSGLQDLLPRAAALTCREFQEALEPLLKAGVVAGAAQLGPKSAHHVGAMFVPGSIDIKPPTFSGQPPAAGQASSDMRADHALPSAR
jgi:hypothetical protein